MHKKKIVTLTLAMLLNSYAAPTIEVLADGLGKNTLEIKVNDEGKREINKAIVTKVDLYNEEDLTEYNKIYKVNNKNITMTSNGGAYGNYTTDKALDGNLNTHWETETPNSSTFTNEVVFTFDEVITLDRIRYAARQDMEKGKGFAKKFEIYASLDDSGDDFTLVSKGEYEGASDDLIEIKFDKTKFKRLKFKFTKADGNLASASEFMFYKADLVWDKVKNLFTNGLMNQLSDEFNTKEKLDALEKEVQSHPLKTLFEKDIAYAKEVLENRVNSNAIIEVQRRGNSVEESKKRKLWNFKDWQVTGLTARPGDVLQVYVDVKEGEPTPRLVYKQSMNNGATITFKLERGKNTIVIPEYNDDVPENTIFGGALYITNYDSDKQTQDPKVRIEGGQKYPMYVDGKSNDEQVMKELETYVQKVKQDPKNTVDVFDISTNQTLITVKATYALDWYKNNKKMPSYTAKRWEGIMDKTYKFWGFDDSTELNSRFNSRMIFMVENISGRVFMSAVAGTVGVRPNNQDVLLDASTGWGLMHEIGHNMDTSGRTMVDLTNNILPIYMAAAEGRVTRITTDNAWESKIYPKVAKDDYSKNVWQDPSGENSVVQLSPLWQLYLYDNTFYPKFEQTYRANDFKLKNREEIVESWVKVSSDILNLNLCEFFERHGIHPSEKIKAEVSKYPKPGRKLWYLNDRKINYKGNGFSEDSKVDLSIDRFNNGVKLTFNIDKSSESDLLGYEILKNGKVIGFTSTDTFTDTNVDYTKNSIYEVIPYDNNLGTGKSAKISLFSPSISIKQDKISLKLNEKFNPKDYIKAFDYKNNDITSKVDIKSNVNTKNEGLYTVKYTVNDNGFNAEKTIYVEVVSDYEYLSDINWKSAKCGWGSIQKDKSIEKNPLRLTGKDGKVVEYKKV